MKIEKKCLSLGDCNMCYVQLGFGSIISRFFYFLVFIYGAPNSPFFVCCRKREFMNLGGPERITNGRYWESFAWFFNWKKNFFFNSKTSRQIQGALGNFLIHFQTSDNPTKIDNIFFNKINLLRLSYHLQRFFFRFSFCNSKFFFLNSSTFSVDFSFLF